jgi:uncharacterized protein YcfJ
MARVLIAAVVLLLAVVVTSSDTLAQSATGRGSIIGGMAGAAIGGIAGGGRGAAIGAAVGMGTGALIGSQADMQRRRGNYYWYNGRCWVRFRNGEFHPVSHRYCR